MVVYLWCYSDNYTKQPIGLFTKYFDKFPSGIYFKWAYKEVWEPFLKIEKGDYLIIIVGFEGLPNDVLNRIIKSDFRKKILLLLEVPFGGGISKIYNNLPYFLKIFHKIYTYIKPLTDKKRIFYLGSFFLIFRKPSDRFYFDLENVCNKINRIGMVLSEHSRMDFLNIKNIKNSFKNPKKIWKLILQLLRPPNEKLNVAGIQYHKIYGIRSKYARYFDKKDIIDIYGKTGWFKTKNYKGECENAWTTLLQYRWSLCIENNDIDNYFSEKPIQAFLTGCVPIIYGGPNPDDILPKDSFINLRNINYKQIPDYIQDEEKYYGHLQIIKKNYKELVKYTNVHYRLFKILNTNSDLCFQITQNK
ncbi:MAG: glycosyltransferase family 10 domain-containing protein [Candidatus Helarchaeota archaeon]